LGASNLAPIRYYLQRDLVRPVLPKNVAAYWHCSAPLKLQAAVLKKFFEFV
jgi:hypothetical protein